MNVRLFVVYTELDFLPILFFNPLPAQDKLNKVLKNLKLKTLVF